MVQGLGSSRVGFGVKGFKACSRLNLQSLVKENLSGGDGVKFDPKEVLDSC